MKNRISEPQKGGIQTMNIFRPALVIMAATLIILGVSGYGLAFHSGGVAHCDGCHTMHNSQDGAVVSIGDPAGNTSLLIGSDPSSVCLDCHRGLGSYHIASSNTTDVNYTAGGDFAWIVPDYTFSPGWTVEIVPGDSFGHNIIAADFTDYATGDGTHTLAPGGTYPAAALGCTSCHDPHGTKAGVIIGSGSYGDPVPATPQVLGNYRLLGDANYDAPSIGTTTFPFGSDAPIAVAENGGFSNPPNYYSKRVAYGSGMSEWCGNCHGGFANVTVLGDHKHPAGDAAHLGGFAGNYNTYVSTGDMSGVNNYDGLVPIEFGITASDDPALDPANPPAADGGSSNVMCLTCHRAHAGGFVDAGRWDFGTEIIGEEHFPTTGTAGYGLTDPDAGFYKNGASVNIASAYDPFQRSLCNKCHVQD